MGARARAFSLVEMLAVVMIIGILAAVVIPRFTGVTDDARRTSLDGSLAGVRGSIASYRTAAIIAGDAPFPTLNELGTPGAVVAGGLPPNPYTGVSAVASVSRAQADARETINDPSVGWLYHVDNAASPPVAIFYANTTDSIGLAADDGTAITANAR